VFGAGGAAWAAPGGTGAAPPGGKAPVSLEGLARRRAAEAGQAAKPVFLSKAQREAGKREERERQQREKAAKRQGLEEQHRRFDSRSHNASAGLQREEGRRREAERARRQKERAKALERESLKRQYLGGDGQKTKRQAKRSDKVKFKFNWDADEDTSADLNPLYSRPHEAALLFGRGMRAGMDRREQKRAATEHEFHYRRQLQRFAGIKATADDERQKAERLRRAELDRYDVPEKSHWSQKAREDMTERDWRIFREDFNITYKGSNIPKPFRTWEELGRHVPPQVLQAVRHAGYAKPSPIQMASIPVGLQNRDVIGLAETGSGKTCAFVLPMLAYISQQPPMTDARIHDGPYALIMAPTRELVQQIEEEAQKFARFFAYRVVSIVGGQSIEDQGFKLRKGCEIVVATPGRLVDCLKRHYAVLNQCNYIVLDEADRMIDLGFEAEMTQILDAMPSSALKPEDDAVPLEDRVYRTTYMFSATMPPPVERLAKKYMRRPCTVMIGAVGRATDNVAQRILLVKDNEKQRTLTRELEQLDAGDKTGIVFVNTKYNCDAVSRNVENLGFRCVTLHGGKSQEQREAAMDGFKSRKYNILVATDVAGRGIDVKDVALVVNYDMPEVISNYTHRIGRTGRAGKKGTAISFVTMKDTKIFYDLVQLLKRSHVHIPREIANHEAARKGPDAGGMIIR